MIKQFSLGLSVLALAVMAASPAAAQFGGFPSLPRIGKSSSADSGSDDCVTASGKKGKKKRGLGTSILGNAIGDLTGRATGQMGEVGRWIPSADVAGTLTDAIACRLDPAEQVQAAEATVEATRSETVGSTASWQSATRADVSGTSTVVAKSDEAGGMRCMRVTDVVIVGGEETTVTKRMCRGPGQPRYVIAEA